MRLPPHHRLGAGLFGALMVGALLAPVAAAADDAGSLGCKEPLTVVSWDGASDAGDQRAVAITSQQFDSGVDGWSSVSWEAAEDTTLTAVTALRIDGTTSPLEPTPEGTATDVASLSFCGAHTSPSAEPAEPPGDAPDAPAVPRPCDDLLVVIGPAGTEGDEHAVTITAQAFDGGADRWSNVAWEAARGTTLREVRVTGADGTVTRITDGTDNAVEVVSLTFCGTRTPPVPAPTDPRDTATRDTAPSRTAPRSSTPAPGVRRPSGTATSTSSNATPAPRAQTPSTPDPAVTGPQAPTDPTDELLPEVDIEPPEAQADTSTEFNDRSSGPGDRSTEPDDERDEEVEVMGIQLARDEQPAGSGPIGAVGALLAVLGLLATIGGLLWSRRS